jgi:hypothetical protein
MNARIAQDLIDKYEKELKNIKDEKASIDS